MARNVLENTFPDYSLFATIPKKFEIGIYFYWISRRNRSCDSATVYGVMYSGLAFWVKWKFMMIKHFIRQPIAVFFIYFYFVYPIGILCGSIMIGFHQIHASWFNRHRAMYFMTNFVFGMQASFISSRNILPLSQFPCPFRCTLAFQLWITNWPFLYITITC